MDSFIEINAEIVVHFEDWVYDAIINRTIKELEDDNMVNFVEFINLGKREVNGYLSLLDLETKDYKKLARYFRRAYNNSQPRKSGVYNRKAHNQFLKEFKNFTGLLFTVSRYLE